MTFTPGTCFGRVGSCENVDTGIEDMVTVDELINKIDELDTKIYRLEKENKDLIEYKNQYCEILKNVD